MILLEADPNAVTPGWMPLLVTLLLAGAMVFLYFSMRKQFRKIRTPDDAADNPEETAEDSVSKHPPGTGTG
ncbi:MAG TPA: hypothetical protein VJN19_14345 [Propionibacteriaceae bacterium]|jgi:hypothetical protein|nr:hypothetical protein [Propionibacteriaceae bacterium]